MSCGIYKIQNLLNGKIYVGQSINIEKRWNRHKTSPFNENCNTYNSFFYRTIRKYGIENFSFSILELCTKDKLNDREVYWIKFYSSNNNKKGYNLTLGGHSGTPTILTLEKVEDIRKLLKTTKKSQKQISKEFNISQRMVSSINIGETWYSDNQEYPLRKIEEFFCKCGEKISSYTKTSRCLRCVGLDSRVVERPSKEKLKEQLIETNFSAVGKKYGVSDNAIRKWCKNYGMSTKSKDYK